MMNWRQARRRHLPPAWWPGRLARAPSANGQVRQTPEVESDPGRERSPHARPRSTRPRPCRRAARSGGPDLPPSSTKEALASARYHWTRRQPAAHREVTAWWKPMARWKPVAPPKPTMGWKAVVLRKQATRRELVARPEPTTRPKPGARRELVVRQAKAKRSATRRRPAARLPAQRPRAPRRPTARRPQAGRWARRQPRASARFARPFGSPCRAWPRASERRWRRQAPHRRFRDLRLAPRSSCRPALRRPDLRPPASTSRVRFPFRERGRGAAKRASERSATTRFAREARPRRLHPAGRPRVRSHPGARPLRPGKTEPRRRSA
jgi:hypothetical protein